MSSPTSTQQTYVDLANKYMELRIAKKNQEILDTLVDDNIVIKSERDGIHTGKNGVKAYLERIPPTGKWNPAQPYQGDKAYITGTVNYMWMDWQVFGLFSFNNNKISKIVIKRGTIDQ